MIKNIDNEELSSDRSSISGTTVIDADTNVNNMVKNFNSCLIDVCNKHAPLITQKTRKCRTPWMHADVLNLIHKRNCEYKKFMRSKIYESYGVYKALRGAVINAVQLAKRNFS